MQFKYKMFDLNIKWLKQNEIKNKMTCAQKVSLKPINYLGTSEHSTWSCARWLGLIIFQSSSFNRSADKREYAWVMVPLKFQSITALLLSSKLLMFKNDVISHSEEN